jgi:hypothetical protein
MYEVPKKSGGGMKKTTLREARELDLLPSVTTILRVLNKPNLNDWLNEQACLAVLTTPRPPEESLDAFVHRVLHVEMVQDEESKLAREKGTAIHDAIEVAVNGMDVPPVFKPFVDAAIKEIAPLGSMAFSEKIIVGDGYAGRCDYGAETDRHIAVLDFKTAKNIPKEPYPEHKMQVAAYCKGLGNSADKHVVGGLLYISTSNPGEVRLCLMDNWERDYEEGFKKAMELWQYLNSYKP